MAAAASALRRVDKSDEAGKGQLGLVADDGAVVVAAHGPGRHAEHAIALFAEPLEALQQASRVRRFVERQAFAARLSHSRRDSSMMSSGAPFTTSSRVDAVVDEHGDAAALEIERHLVDLLPSRDIEPAGGRGSPRRAGS